ncbi:MAG: hypothetical protein ACOX6V_05910 [Patescibacteria group bacterium]|jgi:cell division protein FtsB
MKNNVTPSPQTNEVTPAIKPKNNYFLFILTNLLAAIVGGGAIFFWQSYQTEKIINNFQLQIHDLQNQISQTKSEKEKFQEQINTLNEELQEANQYKNTVVENNRKNVCLDSDGGQDYYINGSIMYRRYDENGNITATGDSSDDCVDAFINGETKNVLREYYCDNNQVQYSYFVCPNGCLRGVCIE